MKQEPLQHDPQREVIAAPTEIYREALQYKNNKTLVYQFYSRSFLLFAGVQNFTLKHFS